MIWKTPLTIEELQKRCANTFVSHLKIVFTEVGDDYLKAEMPIGPYLMQPMGIMHGGVSCSLAGNSRQCSSKLLRRYQN